MRAPGAVEVRDLTYVLHRPLLQDVSLTFRPGELTALSGPSGSGKTTLLSIVGGLVEATSGTVEYADRPTWRGTGDPPPEMAFVLQVYGLVPILSALENVSVALRARGVKPAEADEARRGRAGPLPHRRPGRPPGRGAVGWADAARGVCARGFVVRPEILLADEPTSALDEGNRSMVLDELRAEAREGAIVVVATHDPAVVAACDRHYALDEGELVLAEDQRQSLAEDQRQSLSEDQRQSLAERAPAPAAPGPPAAPEAPTTVWEPDEPHGLTPSPGESSGPDSPFARPPREP